MKTKTSILALIKAFFILLVMCCYSSCKQMSHTPEKPFIIIEKSYGYGDDTVKIWRYVYSGKNSVTRKFSEKAERYNIGDTIK